MKGENATVEIFEESAHSPHCSVKTKNSNKYCMNFLNKLKVEESRRLCMCVSPKDREENNKHNTIQDVHMMCQYFNCKMLDALTFIFKFVIHGRL